MKKITILLAIGIFLLLVTCISRPEAELVITNARIITGTGEVIENGSVSIKENRILSVEDEVSSAEGSHVINAKGKTVLPGLIDTHVHLLPGDDEPPLVNSDSTLASRIQDELPGELNDYLQAGITTVLSTGDFWPHIREVGMQLESGTIQGPRMLTAGPALTATDGHPAVTVCRSNPWCREYLVREVDTAKEAQQTVQQLSDQGVDAIKMVFDNRSPSGVEKLKPELIGVISEAAHQNERLAYAHIYTTADAIHAIENGLDRLVHIPAFESEPDQRQQLSEIMLSENVTGATTLTILDALTHRFTATGDSSTAQALNQIRAEVEQTISVVAEQNSGLIALGTDAPMLTAREAFHREVELLHDAGLTPQQIIRAATHNAAIHIGREVELGSIEPGKIADIILVEGDPLNDLTVLKEVELVIQQGKIVVDKL
jgi:imidazolonepropionase-like amidohydrolase